MKTYRMQSNMRYRELNEQEQKTKLFVFSLTMSIAILLTLLTYLTY
jgi:uncharacterized membrane protein (DUF485 family)